MRIIIIISIMLTALFSDIKVVTDRSDFHLKQIAKDFERETGTKVSIFYTKKGLLQRAKADDYDVIISKNSSEIVAAKEAGMVKMLPQSMYHMLDVNVKDEDFTWFNMSYRIRAFYVKKGFDNPPLSYSDLANPAYKGKICTRKHTHNYNLELYGNLLDNYGEKEFKKWFAMFNSNLARKPVGNDRNQVKGIFEGECEIAIANTYYMGLMLNNPKQKAWTDSVDLIIPNQHNAGFLSGDDFMKDYKFRGDGAIGIFSGVALLNESRKETESFLHFLISPAVQKGLSKYNYEYPIENENIGKDANGYGSFQGLTFKDIKMEENKQNKLFHLRKDVYRLIK